MTERVSGYLSKEIFEECHRLRLCTQFEKPTSKGFRWVMMDPWVREIFGAQCDVRPADRMPLIRRLANDPLAQQMITAHPDTIVGLLDNV